MENFRDAELKNGWQKNMKKKPKRWKNPVSRWSDS